MRKFRRRSIRRRVRWDMQTFRDCERQVDLPLTTQPCEFPCSAPFIVADLLVGPVASTDTPMIPGASRAMIYGGGYLKYRYDLATITSSNMPCSFNIKIITALAKLPLLEDDLTPSYLPNLAIARSQLSVVHATQSDNDEDLLYWDDDQLLAWNSNCSAIGGDCTADPGCSSSDNSVWRFNGPQVVAAAMYGRTQRAVRIKVKRRLREREAIFLLTQMVAIHSDTQCDSQIDWPIRRTVYHRYAVRVSR